MGLLETIRKLSENLPEVKKPTQRKLSFREKLKWTGIILLLFFALSAIPLFGMSENAFQQFEFLSIILGADFGSIMSLGIGPIVTASIVLQLLVGSGMLGIDLTTKDGKIAFEGLQKILTIFFIIFEAGIYVLMGGLAPSEMFLGTPVYLNLQIIMIVQLMLGGLLIVYMDDVVSKWGFGSGVSLFILAGVSKSIFLTALSPLRSPSEPNLMSGAVWVFLQAIAGGDPQTAMLKLAAIGATVAVFIICVYGQAMKVEIPLSFGRIRGYSLRWPLSFIYTSVIPVILVSALMANIQLWARLMENWGHPILGTFINNRPATGVVAMLNPPELVNEIIRGSFTLGDLKYALFFMLFMIGGSVLFGIFWVQTSGMDAKSQAKQIMSSGLQVPGFRRDPRIMERILERYIGPLTVMGGIFVGFLAAMADILGALSRGTGILLAVMIAYRLYEDIAKQHMMDMHPMLRRFIKT